MKVLRMTGLQHASLKAHLFPGDGKEAVAILLCGRQQGDERQTMLVHKIITIPHDDCTNRAPDRITWPTASLIANLPMATKRHWAVVKIHSHPLGNGVFSPQDDASDLELFESIESWMDDGLPHASAVMLPGGRIFGRWVQNGMFTPIDQIAVAGSDLAFWFSDEAGELEHAADLKNAQAFGPGTVNLLKRLRVGVVGCSGTGSPVIEMLARLGVGSLVLVDPDPVEEKNLNRILNATMIDAASKAKKVHVMERAIGAMGLDTKVLPIDKDLGTIETVKAVAGCDVIFGCMDSIDGRYMLNRLAACYLIPYIDVGVKLEADGHGGIDEIVGTVHFLQPDGSSLMSRGVFTPEDLQAANLYKTDPQEYERMLKAKYISRAQVERPAVISVNMFYASLAVNELLARIHCYRFDNNDDFAAYCVSLAQGELMKSCDAEAGPPCAGLGRLVGRGDILPLLNMPELSW